MEVIVKRQQINRLYTMGCFLINGEEQTCTVESTEGMLPAGTYLVRLVSKHAHKRELEIFSPDGQPVGWRIGIAHSWVSSRRHHIIAIGQPLIPGAVCQSAGSYERIIKRLEKCEARKEAINLIIDERHFVQTLPISHWTKPPCLLSEERNA